MSSLNLKPETVFLTRVMLVVWLQAWMCRSFWYADLESFWVFSEAVWLDLIYFCSLCVPAVCLKIGMRREGIQSGGTMLIRNFMAKKSRAGS